MPDPIANKSTLSTLRYFRRGHSRDPNQFWLADTNRRVPPTRISRLINAGLLERAPFAGDLFRITTAGLEVLGDA